MRQTNLFVLLCCAALGASCSKQPLTGAKVDLLAGPMVPAGIRTIDFTLTLAGKTVTATLADPRGGDIAFPTDAFFEIRSGTGHLDITVSAKDASGNEVDAGSGSGTVSSGRTVNIDVAMQGGVAALGWGAPSYDFGIVAVGQTAGPFMVALTNTGTVATGNLALSFGGTGPYTIAADACTGKPLGPGATCTVGVAYSPNATGPAQGTLTAIATPFRSPALTLSGSGGLALTVVKQGSGAGTVSLASGTPVCGDTCSTATLAVEPGATVSLVAAAQSGSAFRGWSSNCAASGSACNLTVGSDTVVSASFNTTVVVTVSKTGTGVGSIVSTPAGIDCGTVCSTPFDLNSTVLLTATADSSSTFSSWSLGSCTTASCSVTASGPVQIAGAFTCSYDRVASASQGSDANPGTCASPFKTIGRALSSGLTSGQSVLVKPGLYDAPGNGESFPLVLPAGVNLLGDEANKGDGAAPVAINGAGLVGSSTTIAAAVAPAANSLVAGFLITGAFSGTAPPGVTAIGIVPAGNNIVIRNNTITASGVGIGYVQTTSGNKVEGNVVTGNDIGVRYDMSGGDLGGGSAGSAGGNVLSCNRTNDIWTNQNNLTINAANDLWDHASPTNSCSTAGADLCGAPGGLFTSPTNFVTTSARQVTSPAPCP